MKQTNESIIISLPLNYIFSLTDLILENGLYQYIYLMYLLNARIIMAMLMSYYLVARPVGHIMNTFYLTTSHYSFTQHGTLPVYSQSVHITAGIHLGLLTIIVNIRVVGATITNHVAQTL